jgi:hypothetical protein
MLYTSTDNQTQLDPMAGFGTLNYTAIPSHNVDIEGRVLTPTGEFLQRIQSEDPFEGPSWHFQNDVTNTGRKRKSQPFSAQKSTTKVSTVKSLCNKFQVIWSLDFVCF